MHLYVDENLKIILPFIWHCIIIIIIIILLFS